VQGHDHPLLLHGSLLASAAHWIGPPPSAWTRGEPLRCQAKIRYRQPDQACTVVRTGEHSFEARFDEPQRTPTPGQFIVLYDGDRCLGGGTIEGGGLTGREVSARLPTLAGLDRTTGGAVSAYNSLRPVSQHP
jgi:tRNA U34 2-thiouridine synthase MnmA/TrmU